MPKRPLRFRSRRSHSHSSSSTLSSPSPISGPTWSEVIAKAATKFIYLTFEGESSMSRYFPHSENEEDQKLEHTLLAFHVLHRGFEVGAGVGAIASVAIYYGANLLPTTNALRTRLTIPYKSLFLKSTGVGGLAGIALLAVGLEQRMKGRENIEWKDRSWRLRENKGQMEVDDFALLGTVVGGVLARQGGWKTKVGGAAVGNLAGVAAYMGWRYGVRKGEWREGERGL